MNSIQAYKDNDGKLHENEVDALKANLMTSFKAIFQGEDDPQYLYDYLEKYIIGKDNTLLELLNEIDKKISREG